MNCASQVQVQVPWSPSFLKTRRVCEFFSQLVSSFLFLAGIYMSWIFSCVKSAKSLGDFQKIVFCPSDTVPWTISAFGIGTTRVSFEDSRPDEIPGMDTIFQESLVNGEWIYFWIRRLTLSVLNLPVKFVGKNNLNCQERGKGG